MKRFIVLITLMGVMFAMSPSTAMAGHTLSGSVEATVTPALVAISVSGALSYGAQHLGVTLLSSPTTFDDENTGNVNETFTISGLDSANWTLVTGAPVANEYRHRADLDGNFALLAIALTTGNTVLAATVTTGSPNVDVFLELTMPAIVTTGTTEQTLQVIVTATAA